MSEKVELFHFDDIANEYHGESLYCGLCSSLSLQVDKDCTITVYGQINPRSGEYFKLQVLNEETMENLSNITKAGNYFVHIAGCYRVKFEVENAAGVSVGGVFGKYHYPSADVDLDGYATTEYVDSKVGAATEEEFKEMLNEVLYGSSPSEPDESEQDVPGVTPVYKLAEPKNFIPDNKEYIDTGIKMFDSINPKPNWTVLFEVQYGENVSSISNTYVLMHCMNEESPWPGLAIQVVADGQLNLNIYKSVSSFGMMPYFKEQKHKCAIRISDSTAKRWRADLTPIELTIQGYDSAVDKTLILGAYQKLDGTKGRFFDGTLYQCIVYNSALTDEQIETWMKK